MSEETAPLPTEPTARADAIAYRMRDYYEANKPLHWWQKRRPAPETCIADDLMLGLLNVVTNALREARAQAISENMEEEMGEEVKARELLAAELRRFHSHSCYPIAMDFEVDAAVDRILSALQPAPLAGDEIERVAKAMYVDMAQRLYAAPLSWDAETENERKEWRLNARAALAAVGRGDASLKAEVERLRGELHKIAMTRRDISLAREVARQALESNSHD